ncbi:hypothetical protein ACV1C6_16515, partial [Aeromonas sanarellii]
RQGATVDQGMIVSLFPVNAIWVNSYPTRPIIRFIIQTSSLVAPASLLTICVLKPLIKGAHYTNYGATK